jgi:hypothetical protein
LVGWLVGWLIPETKGPWEKITELGIQRIYNASPDDSFVALARFDAGNCKRKL